MKTVKKLSSLALILALLLSLSTSALADTTPAISVASTDTHTYSVYQIFTGDFSASVLSNVKWGANGTGAAGAAVDAATLTALGAVSSGEKTNSEKLAVIKTHANLEGTVFGTLSASSSVSAPNGYYLIKDLGVSNGNGGYSLPEGDAHSTYVVKIVGASVEIAPKKSSPTVEKKIKLSDGSLVDAASYNIGDTVTFVLKAKLATISDYSTYKVVFNDTLGAGLTYKEVTSIKVGDAEKKDAGVFTVTPSGQTLTVSCDDVKTLGATDNSVITVTYTATLDSDAEIGAAGNPNTVNLQYSNNPNYTGEAADSPLGKTPDDTVKVYTFKLNVNKTDGTNPLKGAGFTLYRFTEGEGADTFGTGESAKVGTYAAIGSEVKGENMTTFTWSGIADGMYKLTETTTPSGYNTAAPIEFTISSTFSGTDLNTLSSSNSNITAEKSSEKPTGTLSTTVVNNQGSTLPETGGIGTTIFYIAGSILLLGAGVLLITKKRMDSEK